MRRGKHERCKRHPVPVADEQGDRLVVMVDRVCTGVCWFARRFARDGYMHRAEQGWGALEMRT